MSEPASEGQDQPTDLIERIRNIVESAALDCDCRDRVDEALERFVEMEQQRETRRHLLSSRQHRAAIAALVDLLAELEEIGWQEMDRTVFSELAHLFEDIAQHALSGAQQLRQIEKDVSPKR